MGIASLSSIAVAIHRCLGNFLSSLQHHLVQGNPSFVTFGFEAKVGFSPESRSVVATTTTTTIVACSITTCSTATVATCFLACFVRCSATVAT